jgi:hypothetical protein
MKTIDGWHRGFDPDDHSAWCQRLFNNLADGGDWMVPRTGLTFTRRGDKLVLTKRLTGFDPRDQQADYRATQRQFAKIGIIISDETGGHQQ